MRGRRQGRRGIFEFDWSLAPLPLPRLRYGGRQKNAGLFVRVPCQFLDLFEQRPSLILELEVA